MAGPPPYNYPVYQPAMREVTAITNDFPALVTTSFAHNYVSGMYVRLYVPDSYGMVQANQLLGLITVTSSTQFTISIDTRNFDPFVVPPNRVYPEGPSAQVQFAQVVPVGELTAQVNASTRNVLPYP